MNKKQGKTAAHKAPGARNRPAGSARAAVGSNRSTTAIDPSRVFVRDIMKKDVVVLRTDNSIKEAAGQLEEIHASGAPVVDAAGRLVGVLTLSDIARSEHVEEGGVTTSPETGSTAEGLEGMVDEAGVDEEVFPTEEYDEELLGRLVVADWMTPGVISIAPDATIAAACRCMLDEAIHRLFVVEQERLVGVISTEDVVRLVAGPRQARAAAAGRPARTSR